VAGPVGDDVVDAIGATRRLVDSYEVDRSEAGVVVTLTRSLPRSGSPSAAEIESIRTEVTAMVAGTPLDELAEHNRQLLSTVELVQAHRDELLRMNAELAETNRGVMALYTELSTELEATNRGVVALYAELDQRTEQARAANEAKTRFLANVSHELRAPVTAIVGLVRLIRDPASDPLTTEQDDQLEFIDSSAHSLLGLVNDLLDLAKAESGKLEPTLEPVALADIFATLSGTMRAVPRSESTVLLVGEAAVPPLLTDPILLTQVLRNLVTNGLKFTPAGQVRLSASYDRGPDEVVLEVSDTGIGIPAEEQERVFEEFHQVRHPHRPAVTGTGLGLPYARRLALILGGNITLASQPGRGSTFTVRLPVGGPSIKDS
jgi:signal transduction histidine kinase